MRILVIKLGALGDFLLSIGPMQAIRRHHPDADIVLLTRPPYRDLGERTGLFDQIWEDDAPKTPSAWLALRRRLRGGRFDRVYDLQTSSRSAWYFRMMAPGRPEWSGKVWGCSYRHVYPADHQMHTVDRQRAQLSIAGLTDVPRTDLSFLDGDLGSFSLPERFVILVPAASPGRPEKCWPVARYAALSERLDQIGLTSVIVGGKDAQSLAEAIQRRAPRAIDLTGKTDLGQVAVLARRAAVCIGNDTGPTHLVSLAGCPTLGLFGPDSNPLKTGPAGPKARYLQVSDLQDLTVDDVLTAMPSRTAEASAPAPKPETDSC